MQALAASCEELRARTEIRNHFEMRNHFETEIILRKTEKIIFMHSNSRS
jgi:hypothetical protein